MYHFENPSLFMISPYMIAYFVHGHGSQVMSALYILIKFYLENMTIQV